MSSATDIGLLEAFPPPSGGGNEGAIVMKSNSVRCVSTTHCTLGPSNSGNARIFHQVRTRFTLDNGDRVSARQL